MAYILNIETATKNCSVALDKDGITIICKEISELGFSHAEKLHVFIEEIIIEAHLSFTDIDAIAVSAGPGSYTGLRIGVSAAKGFSFALGIPLISVETLTSLSQQVPFNDGLIVPMIDARRMEVYSAVFNSDKKKIRKVEAQILEENSFDDFDGKIYFVGDANEKAKLVLTKPNYIFVDTIIHPSAKDMSAISFTKFEDNAFEDVAYYEPYYLKDFLFAK